jgi:hypothetical protein
MEQAEPVSMQIFPLASGLTVLPRAELSTSASSARPSDHLSVIRRARNEHGHVQCQRITDPQDWIAHGPPFGSPSGLALSMPVCMQIFPLASGLTALPRAHHAPASTAHLSVIRRARVEHDRVQCHRP